MAAILQMTFSSTYFAQQSCILESPCYDRIFFPEGSVDKYHIEYGLQWRAKQNFAWTSDDLGPLLQAQINFNLMMDR